MSIVGVVAGNRAGIYVRISDDRAGGGLGVARQETDCRALCDRNNWAVADVYVDNDTSAYSGKPRPAYRQLLAALDARTIDVVVAWHPDRLHRSPRELEDFIDVLEQAKATVHTVTAGTYDLATPSGRMVARTLGNAARYESEHKAERIRRKHMELAQAGRRPGGGTRQFGYLDANTINPDEAALIRDAAQRVLAGESVRSVCATWNASGVPSVTGRGWTQTVLKRILVAPSVAGYRQHQGARYKATWPAILDDATHRRLTAVLLDPARRTSNGNARRYLLAGYLRCGRCGAPLVARPKQDRRRQYVCAKDAKGCGRLGILAEPLEELVVDALYEHLDLGVVTASIAGRDGTDDQAVLDAIANDEAQLVQWAIDRDDGLVTRSQMVAATQRINARIAANRRRLVRLTRDSRATEWAGHGSELRTQWDRLTLDQRRVILGTYIDSITVAPAVHGRNTFDPGRVLDSDRGPGIAWVEF